MGNKKSIYRTTLLSCTTLIIIFICSIAFIGCPEAGEITDSVVQPNIDPNVDPNVDPTQ